MAGQLIIITIEQQLAAGSRVAVCLIMMVLCLCLCLDCVGGAQKRLRLVSDQLVRKWSSQVIVFLFPCVCFLKPIVWRSKQTNKLEKRPQFHEKMASKQLELRSFVWETNTKGANLARSH